MQRARYHFSPFTVYTHNWGHELFFPKTNSKILTHYSVWKSPHTDHRFDNSIVKPLNATCPLIKVVLPYWRSKPRLSGWRFFRLSKHNSCWRLGRRFLFAEALWHKSSHPARTLEHFLHVTPRKFEHVTDETYLNSYHVVVFNICRNNKDIHLSPAYNWDENTLPLLSLSANLHDYSLSEEPIQSILRIYFTITTCEMILSLVQPH